MREHIKMEKGQKLWGKAIFCLLNLNIYIISNQNPDFTCILNNRYIFIYDFN